MIALNTMVNRDRDAGAAYLAINCRPFDAKRRRYLGKIRSSGGYLGATAKTKRPVNQLC